MAGGGGGGAGAGGGGAGGGSGAGGECANFRQYLIGKTTIAKEGSVPHESSHLQEQVQGEEQVQVQGDEQVRGAGARGKERAASPDIPFGNLLAV